MKGYDEWKTRLPPERISDDPNCTCTSERRNKWCQVHGLDPDDERDKQIERERP
jgi:hypothetical protein